MKPVLKSSVSLLEINYETFPNQPHIHSLQKKNIYTLDLGTATELSEKILYVSLVILYFAKKRKITENNNKKLIMDPSFASYFDKWRQKMIFDALQNSSANQQALVTIPLA